MYITDFKMFCCVSFLFVFLFRTSPLEKDFKEKLYSANWS